MSLHLYPDPFFSILGNKLTHENSPTQGVVFSRGPGTLGGGACKLIE